MTAAAVWRAVVAKAKALWAREPVLLASAVPVLVIVGLLTTRQASELERAVTSSVAFVTQLAAALTARAHVTAPATKAKKG